MLLLAIGAVVAFSIGALCRMLDIPVPAPPRIEGALLVVAMTLGFVVGMKLHGG